MNQFDFLALAHINGMRPQLLQALESHLGNATEVINAPVTLLKSLKLNDGMIKDIKYPPKSQVDSALKWARQEEQHLLTWHDPRYPALLKEISAPPPMLFIKGELQILDTMQMAMVGSRTPTLSGKKNAFSFARSLADLNITITSGLARGIDRESHLGALAANGKTIAILAHGMNMLYPKENAKLADDIVHQGALVTEFPLTTQPRPHHFPQRNRLISGLSWGTIIVEAKLKSGSLISAHLALEQGREVFAMPGSIHNTQAKGCHALIKQGAKLVESIDDILVEMPDTFRQTTTKIKKKHRPILEKNLQNLVEFVGYETTSLDDICANCHLSPTKIQQMLLNLELKGLIKAVIGGYVRV